MPTFALIAEGLTDQLVIERLIEQVCASAFVDDIDVNPLQPIRDRTDAFTAPHGGWQLVFEYCAARAEDALLTNDFLVVHVDTDEGDKEGFDVPLTANGVDRPFNEIVDNAIAKIIDSIGNDLFQENKDRILFAIPVLSTESWILLILYNKDQSKSGFDRLKREIRREGKHDPLVKSFDCYSSIVKLIKLNRLNQLTNNSTSLGLFLQKLSSLKSDETTE